MRRNVGQRSGAEERVAAAERGGALVAIKRGGTWGGRANPGRDLRPRGGAGHTQDSLPTEYLIWNVRLCDKIFDVISTIRCDLVGLIGRPW